MSVWRMDFCFLVVSLFLFLSPFLFSFSFSFFEAPLFFDSSLIIFLIFITTFPPFLSLAILPGIQYLYLGLYTRAFLCMVSLNGFGLGELVLLFYCFIVLLFYCFIVLLFYCFIVYCFIVLLFYCDDCC